MSNINTSIPISKIDFANKTAKRLHDTEIINTLEDNKHLIMNKSVLCFPNSHWIFEQLLKERIPFFKEFVGVEQDSKIFKDMKIKADKISDKGFKLDSYNGMDIDFFTSTKKTFGYIYLDWMGGWNSAKEESLNILSKNNVVDPKGCIISYVVTAGREHLTLQDLKDSEEIPFLLNIDPTQDNHFGRFPYSNFRKYGIPKKFTEIMTQNGYNTIPLQVSAYREVNKGVGEAGCGSQPQLHFMFYVKKASSKDHSLSTKKSVDYNSMIVEYDRLLKDESIPISQRSTERCYLLKFAKKHFPNEFLDKDFKKLKKKA